MEENRQNGPSVQKNDASSSRVQNGLTAAQWRNTAAVAGVLAIVFVGSYLWFQSRTEQELPSLPPATADNSESLTGQQAGQAESSGVTPGVNPTETDVVETSPTTTTGEPRNMTDVQAEAETGTAVQEGVIQTADIPEGAFIWPATGWVSQQFGWQYSETFQDWRWHSGIDIVTAAEASVLSAADGVVRSVREDTNWGTVIEVEYADQWVFRYGNVTNVQVEEGQEVAQGEILATIGEPGLIEQGQQDILHLETVQEDVERDPLTVIQLSEAF